jgi:hypothetical protein
MPGNFAKLVCVEFRFWIADISDLYARHTPYVFAAVQSGRNKCQVTGWPRALDCAPPGKTGQHGGRRRMLLRMRTTLDSYEK